MKRIAIVLSLLALASLAPATGYRENANMIGPLVGFGYHDLMLGGQFEHGFHKNIGGGALVGWSGESYEYYYGDVSYSFIVLGGQANWHFMPADKVDPFAGLVLGYELVSGSWHWAPGYDNWHGASTSNSRMVLGISAGCNYFFNPRTSGTCRIGYPYYLSLGVSFAI